MQYSQLLQKKKIRWLSWEGKFLLSDIAWSKSDTQGNENTNIVQRHKDEDVWNQYPKVNPWWFKYIKYLSDLSYSINDING